jgi:hypothetical protein
MIDVTRAEQLFRILAEVTDQPLYEESKRSELSATLAITALEIARSVRILCAADQLLGATVCLRSQYESLISMCGLYTAQVSMKSGVYP